MAQTLTQKGGGGLEHNNNTIIQKTSLSKQFTKIEGENFFVKELNE